MERQMEFKQTNHVILLIAISFILSAVLFFVSWMFPLQIVDGIPVMSDEIIFLGRIQSALYILGSTAFSIYLSEQKKTMVAIGFAMLSIAYGVIFVLYLISFNTKEDLQSAYQLFMGSMNLLLPAFIIIALSAEFKWYLNLAGLLGCCFYLAENIYYHYSNSFNQTMMIIDGTGQIIFNLQAIGWGLQLILILRKEKKILNS